MNPPGPRASREVIAAGVGPDGAIFLGTDAAGAPCSIYRLRALDDEDEKRRRARRFEFLAAARITRSLALRKLDLAGGIVIIERTARTLAQAMEQAGESIGSAASIRPALPGPMNESEALGVALDIARALADLHRAGLVHGALDPYAVWLGDDGGALLDVTGLKCSTRSDALTRACRAGGCEDKAAGDIWALGVILLACIEGATAACAFVEGGSGERTTASDKESSRDRRLVALAHDMLDAEPSWRPTAADVLRRLEELRGAPPAGEAPRVRDATDPAATTMFRGSTDSDAGDPMQLGRFRIGALLGEGAMGRVYKALDASNGATVAVKVLTGDPAPTARAIKRFKKEARILSEIKNPGVAVLLDAGEDDGRLWMAVEYVDGETLAAYIRRKHPLSENAALALIADLCRALIDVHDRGVVHRDVKPENVLIIESGDDTPHYGTRVKLIDFGIARHLDESGSLAMTRQGAIMGTPLYMAPEQARGDVVDARSDVYSLGTILYEILAGAAPFAGNGAALVLAMQQEKAIPRITEVRPDASDEVARVIARALEKDPAARFQDARELLAACLRLLDEEPSTIATHPRVKESETISRYVFEWDLQSSPRELWPYVSNTDRLNRAIGLGAVDERVEIEDGDPLRLGHSKQVGFDLRWREHPYEWVLERRIGVLREYSEGPLRSMRSTVDLRPRDAASGGGTHLVHTVEIDPRGVVGRAAAAVEVGVRTRRALDRVYHRIDDLLQGGRRTGPSASKSGEIFDAFEAAEPLDAAHEERLRQLEKKIVDAGADAGVVARLGDFVKNAASQDVARLRPLALARRLGLDEDAMVRACLLGAREGLFVPLWDLLCPSCRAPAGIEDTLRAVRDHARCEVCNIDFTLDLATSIEMVFRVHPQIRAADAATYCLSSPGKSPHVMAQVRAMPGERFLLEAALPEGSYQLVGRRLSYGLSFRVRGEGETTRWELSLKNGPPPTLGRVLRAGKQEIVLVNDTGREQLVRVERTSPRDDVFTAARAAGHPLFRQLFPNEVLEPGALVRVASLVLLYADVRGKLAEDAGGGNARAFSLLYGAYKEIETQVGDCGGSVVKIMGDGVLAVFDDAGQAVRAALKLDEAVARVSADVRIHVAVHRGPAAAVTLNERLDYFGKSVAVVTDLARDASRGRVVVSDEVLSDPVVQELLDDRARVKALRLADSGEHTGPIAIA